VHYEHVVGFYAQVTESACSVFVMSVCYSVRVYHSSAFTRWIYVKFNTSADFYGNVSRKSKCCYNYIQISNTLHEGQEHKVATKNCY